ncbi:amidohydrolase [Clostridium autoethanogenum]|uniref:Amidohydrolase n=1 Tax=Clostridium autoethanogenum DSM 10061 TaxID=1341692 RepID=A0ABM5NWM2_9CLOT|nr:amidohydrolase [Clostridium autoethanogenum]AGY76930.1 amidohydrolase [Clostridium autoethanogenum DSM 10061]ALU37075.1 Amidohydrolase [Clostridium autoethanogenum DSM 10061]OVY48529.1 putative hydrolase YxeP [Clostridium autoethanogenum]
MTQQNVKFLENSEDTEFNKKMKDIFEYFHQRPELSYEEYDTTKELAKLLREGDIDILDLPMKTGLVAEIKGKKGGPTIAIRTDIDALPITEETNLTYKSKNKGKMHACGHDFHMTTILGAAYLLKRDQKKLKGNVRILFQPAEESSHGAEEVIKTSALDGVQAIFGLHCNSDWDVGTLGINVGPVTAAVDRFEVEVTGKGTHAAHPELGTDPIVAASNIITALQTIVSRNMHPLNPAIVSVTHMESGHTWNVIPEKAYFEGTVRTLNEKDRELIPEKIKMISENIAEAYGAKANFNWYEGPPATNNDKDWTEVAISVAKKDGYQVKIISPKMGGEDFAYYQKILSGTFVNIGVGKGESLHSPKFKIDELALEKSTKYFKNLAEQALIVLNSKRD